MTKFSDRSTTDLLILLIAGTVCLTVLLSTGAVAVEKFFHPEADTSNAGNVIVNVLNTLIGLLAGFLAGRTEGQRRKRERDEDAGLGDE